MSEPMATSGDGSEYIANPNPESPSTHKKSSIFGKLKDKTRRAGSKIKSRVVRKKNPDGTDAPEAEGDEHEEYVDDDTTTSGDDSPIASPGAPAELGSTFQSEPSRFASDSAAAPVRDMSALSLDEPAAPQSDPHPSFADKAFDASEGTDEAVPKEPESEKMAEDSEPAQDLGAQITEPEVADRSYDTAVTEEAPEQPTDVQGAVESKVEDVNNATGDSETYTEKAHNTAMDAQDAVQYKAEDVNNATDDSETYTEKAHNAATDAQDAVASKAEDVNNATDDSETYTEKAHNTAMDAQDAVASKAEDVNNATDDSKTYTEKAHNAATDAQDAVASKAEDVNNATDDSETYTEKAHNAATDAQDAVQSKAEDVNNATDDSETYTDKAYNTAVDAQNTVAASLGMDTSRPVVDQAKEAMGMDSSLPVVDQAKEAMGMDSSLPVVDQAKEAMGMDSSRPVVDQAKEAMGMDSSIPVMDQAKENTQSALDTTHDHAAQAQQTVTDAATPKPEDKTLSEQVTESLSAVPAQVQDTATSVVQSAKSPTTTTPGTITDAPAAHSSEPASPGILGKITGLFGFGAKHPEDHSHDGHAAH